MKPIMVELDFGSDALTILSCGKCHHGLWHGQNYCPSCGTKLSRTASKCYNLDLRPEEFKEEGDELLTVEENVGI